MSIKITLRFIKWWYEIMASLVNWFHYVFITDCVCVSTKNIWAPVYKKKKYLYRGHEEASESFHGLRSHFRTAHKRKTSESGGRVLQKRTEEVGTPKADIYGLGDGVKNQQMFCGHLLFLGNWGGPINRWRSPWQTSL